MQVKEHGHSIVLPDEAMPGLTSPLEHLEFFLSDRLDSVVIGDTEDLLWRWTLISSELLKESAHDSVDQVALSQRTDRPQPLPVNAVCGLDSENSPHEVPKWAVGPDLDSGCRNWAKGKSVSELARRCGNVA
jgi:hypothetical protein